MITVKQLANQFFKLLGHIYSTILLSFPICLFFVSNSLPSGIKLWLFMPINIFIVLLLLMALLGIIGYSTIWIVDKYPEHFLNWVVSSVALSYFFAYFFFILSIYSSFLGLSLTDFYHFNNDKYYVYLLTVISCINSVEESLPFYLYRINQRSPEQKETTLLINRLVIFLSYIVFLLVTHSQSMFELSIGEKLILSFTFYLAFDKLYITIGDNLPSYKEYFVTIKKHSLDKMKRYYDSFFEDIVLDKKEFVDDWKEWFEDFYDDFVYRKKEIVDVMKKRFNKIITLLDCWLLKIKQRP